VRALEAQVGIETMPGELPCQITLIWSYLDRLRAALVAVTALPRSDQGAVDAIRGLGRRYRVPNVEAALRYLG